LKQLLRWEREWWTAFHQLRDGPLFEVKLDLAIKRYDEREALESLRNMTPEEFYQREMRSRKSPLVNEVLVDDEVLWVSDWASGPPSLRNADSERRRRIAAFEKRLLRRSRLEHRREIWRALIESERIEDLEQACRRWERLTDVRQDLRQARVRNRYRRRRGEPENRICSPSEVTKHADEFLAMKRDRRFPWTNDFADSQIDFLARGMAGVFMERSPQTGIQLLRTMKHDVGGPLWDVSQSRCVCWRCHESLIGKKLTGRLAERRRAARTRT
jgi:hypothetical protein